MSGLRYVYAVCRPFGTPLPAQLTGVAGVPPKQLTHHGLVALVGRVPPEEFAERPLRARLEDPEWFAETSRAHRNVVDALTVVTSPLPLRVATVFPDDSGVRAMMEKREDDFRRTLDRLDGRVEWGVRVYGEAPHQEGRHGSGGPGRGEGGGSGRGGSYAGDRRAGEFARGLHETLSGRAEAGLTCTPGGGTQPLAPGRTVLNAAYLVPRSESEAFVELVQRARAAEPGVRVELGGPWAAYSFTGEEP
ncbi:GvpL/GvpF family gas vesicle protein [Streptomyces fructofermentans]|uniref:Gas vesicle protein n=1 Tax=Streptomyces fructofermentans TaxID=152141 RepID=A0A918NAH0_9ACTN|nr:GvpL/GvpF family gas vesicle protein [Streptomyces fructofermentans]GGX53207.1 gas vesicle protein [Streptomyces fructofermentans]